jgi:hypothetical protein
LQAQFDEFKNSVISIQDHEIIVNRELERMLMAQHNEMEALKVAFEKELRKAERHIKESARKEEASVREINEQLKL